MATQEEIRQKIREKMKYSEYTLQAESELPLEIKLKFGFTRLMEIGKSNMNGEESRKLQEYIEKHPSLKKGLDNDKKRDEIYKKAGVDEKKLNEEMMKSYDFIDMFDKYLVDDENKALLREALEDEHDWAIPYFFELNSVIAQHIQDSMVSIKEASFLVKSSGGK